MQIFKSILCFLVVLLSVLPCADTMEISEKELPENVLKTGQHEDDCADGACSIFCQCAASCSCVGGALAFSVFKSQRLLPLQSVPISFSSLSVSPSKGFPGSSWRPPQI